MWLANERKSRLKLCHSKTIDNKGRKGFNVKTWLQGAGAGEYLSIVNRTRKGQYGSVLRLGSGACDWLDTYAYPTRELAR